jgi:hypothetical protein
MQMTKIAISFVVAMAGLSACGGSGTKKSPDAAPTPDAFVQLDAPAALKGLGQKCMDNAGCPTNASVCLKTAAATFGFCSTICHTQASFMTDAAKMPTNFTDLTADNSKCTAIYTGSAAGTASCFLPVNLTPPPPLVASTNYKFDAFCAVGCGTGNTCPTGTTCSSGICAP